MLMSSDNFSRGIAQAISDTMRGMSVTELRKLTIGSYLNIRATIAAESRACSLVSV